MEPSDIAAFLALQAEGLVEIVLDDDSIEIGRNFKRSSLDMEGKFNLWQLQPDGLVTVIIGGYNIKAIRWL